MCNCGKTTTTKQPSLSDGSKVTKKIIIRTK